MKKSERDDMEETPAARPSNPSIRLIAFVMPTIHDMVRKIGNKGVELKILRFAKRVCQDGYLRI
ncbi:MAG: hypothetical protein ACOX4M_01245 [Acetivibrionales bacterium]